MTICCHVDLCVCHIYEVMMNTTSSFPPKEIYFYAKEHCHNGIHATLFNNKHPSNTSNERIKARDSRIIIITVIVIIIEQPPQNRRILRIMIQKLFLPIPPLLPPHPNTIPETNPRRHRFRKNPPFGTAAHRPVEELAQLRPRFVRLTSVSITTTVSVVFPGGRATLLKGTIEHRFGGLHFHRR